MTAAAPNVMKEASAWIDAEGDADGEGGCRAFDKVHKQVTGKDAGGLLPDTDYAGGGSHLEALASDGADHEGARGPDAASEDSEDDEVSGVVQHLCVIRTDCA